MRISDWSSDVCSSDLAKSWAEDLKGTGIRVNVLSPGPTATELAKAAVGEEGLKVFASMNPLQRMAEPTEIAAGARSEERRVGKECVSTCRSRWSPYQ